MQRLLISFRNAFRGIGFYLSSGKNVTLHIIATVLVIVAGWGLGITKADWLMLLLLMALVHVAEALNTAIEHVVDLASPQLHPLAGKAKDIAAGAVLLAAIAAAIGGLVIFLPYLG
ncbi:MAG: diacylglycerol kinase family protein [Bacteroidia bacterium]